MTKLAPVCFKKYLSECSSRDIGGNMDIALPVLEHTGIPVQVHNLIKTSYESVSLRNGILLGFDMLIMEFLS